MIPIIKLRPSYLYNGKYHLLKDGLDIETGPGSGHLACTGDHRARKTVLCMLENNSWWRHQMEKFSASLAICAGNSPVAFEFPAQRPVTRSFDVFFDLRLNKRLSKQWWGWWFETPSRPLWHYCNAKRRNHEQTMFGWRSNTDNEVRVNWRNWKHAVGGFYWCHHQADAWVLWHQTKFCYH